MAATYHVERGTLLERFFERNRGPLLVAPALAVLVIMNIFPLLWSFGLSFYRYRANRVKEPEFVWFKNYEKVLSDPVVWERFQTTAIIVTIDVLLQLVVGFLLALLFEKTFPGRRVLLMLVLTPMMLSFVAVGAFFRYYYEPTFGLLQPGGEGDHGRALHPSRLRGGRACRHHLRRRLDVVAVRDVAGAGRPR